MIITFVLSPGLGKALEAGRAYRYQFDRINGTKKFYFFNERVLREHRDFRQPARMLNRREFSLPGDVYALRHQSETLDTRQYNFPIPEGRFGLHYEGNNVFAVLDHLPEDECHPWVAFLPRGND